MKEGNSKLIWKGIKNIINVKSQASRVPTVINETIVYQN